MQRQVLSGTQQRCGSTSTSYSHVAGLERKSVAPRRNGSRSSAFCGAQLPAASRQPGARDSIVCQAVASDLSAAELRGERPGLAPRAAGRCRGIPRVARAAARRLPTRPAPPAVPQPCRRS